MHAQPALGESDDSQRGTQRDPHPNQDVRMRGFSSRTSVHDACKWIHAQIATRPPLGIEQTPLLEASDRVLADPLESPFDVPLFARAMMDGYAVRAEAVRGASAESPRLLREVGRSLPGVGFPGTLQGHDTVRIMTGAPIPAGTEAVLPVEQTRRSDSGVEALQEIPAGKHVGPIGEDISAGQMVLPAGRILRPQDVGLLSLLGLAVVPTQRRARVAIASTGSELLPMGTPPAAYRFADSNGPMLHALATRDGAEVVEQLHVADDVEELRRVLHIDADVILISGGSSVGEEDYAPILLGEEGELAIHGVDLRPGRPTGMGRVGQRFVFLLPGNPISCLCAYDFFAGLAIRLLGGRSAQWPYRPVTGKLTRDLASHAGRVEYARAVLTGSDIEPLAISGSSQLSSVTRADGFVVVEASCEIIAAGSSVTLWCYDA